MPNDYNTNNDENGDNTDVDNCDNGDHDNMTLKEMVLDFTMQLFGPHIASYMHACNMKTEQSKKQIFPDK